MGDPTPFLTVGEDLSDQAQIPLDVMVQTTQFRAVKARSDPSGYWVHPVHQWSGPWAWAPHLGFGPRRVIAIGVTSTLPDELDRIESQAARRLRCPSLDAETKARIREGRVEVRRETVNFDDGSTAGIDVSGILYILSESSGLFIGEDRHTYLTTFESDTTADA